MTFATCNAQQALSPKELGTHEACRSAHFVLLLDHRHNNPWSPCMVMTSFSWLQLLMSRPQMIRQRAMLQQPVQMASWLVDRTSTSLWCTAPSCWLLTLHPDKDGLFLM
jgi:hypothetical protein